MSDNYKTGHPLPNVVKLYFFRTYKKGISFTSFKKIQFKMQDDKMQLLIH